MYSIRIAALDNQVVQARTNLEVIRQLSEGDRAYWRLYAAAQLLEVRQKQYELADAQLQRARRRVDAGAAPDVEVIRAESGVAERLEAIITAEVNVRRLQRELKRIINSPGLHVGDAVVIDTGTPPDPVRYALDPRPLADAAVTNRMEMLELELRLAQDLSTIDFEKNQALPLFTLDYRYNVNGLGRDWGRSFEQVGENDYEDWIVSANLEIPLGNEAAQSRVSRAVLQRLQRLSTRSARVWSAAADLSGEFIYIVGDSTTASLV
jgi:outer membrane protein TolC